MTFKELVRNTRSYRRFHQEIAIEEGTLRELIDLARLSASSGNQQPLKFILSCQPEKNALIFPHLRWAGYLADWPGPAEGERPSGYIIILGDKSIKETFDCDHGIAAQSIMLGATEKGLGGFGPTGPISGAAGNPRAPAHPAGTGAGKTQRDRGHRDRWGRRGHQILARRRPGPSRTQTGLR
jgi:nitroreductase